MLFKGHVVPRRGRWRSAVPGMLAVVCAVALVTGAFDEDVRDQMGGVLLGALGGLIVFGTLYFVGRHSLRRPLTLDGMGEAAVLTVAGGPELRGPLRVAHGWFPERMEAGVVAATVAVLWLFIQDSAGRSFAARKALGAAFGPPDGWPPCACPAMPNHICFDIETLRDALEKAGAQPIARA
jgi:hypothetical protein